MSASENNSTIIKSTEYQPNEVMSANDLRTILSQVMELNKSLQATVDRQTTTIAELTRELEWFRRNMFGKISEISFKKSYFMVVYVPFLPTYCRFVKNSNLPHYHSHPNADHYR